MHALKCVGIDLAASSEVSLEFDRVIQSVEPLIRPLANPALLAPGFIDLQLNGFAGVDFNSPRSPQEEIARAIRAVFATGVTRFFPTLITNAPDATLASLANLAAAKESLEFGEAMEGFHVEGPHICPEDGPRGAHPRQWVRPPDIGEFRRWQEAARGNVRLVTMSPEWPGSAAYIRELVREGVVVAIGHTKATLDQIREAISAGATMSTHLGNGAHFQIPRHPNYIWDQLADDRLAASFIPDGIHLDESFLKVALRAKGIERSILVTDAVMPAGCAPGQYRIGDMAVDLLPPGDRVVLPGTNCLAGSALRMDKGIETLVRLSGATLQEAVTMATRNPARVGRIAGRQRGLTPGDRADVVQFRRDPQTGAIRVEKTWVSGQLVYEAA